MANQSNSNANSTKISNDTGTFLLPHTNIITNPSKELVTDNPALSTPYIKYYTSILEEYHALLEDNGSNKYEYPPYLVERPYYSMNPFPRMLVYEGTGSPAISSQNTTGNTSKKVSGADIILTYRATNNRNKYIKEINRKSQDAFASTYGSLLKELGIRLCRPSIIGSNGTVNSQITQLILPYASTGTINNLVINLPKVHLNKDTIADMYIALDEVATKEVPTPSGKLPSFKRYNLVAKNITLNEAARMCTSIGYTQLLGSVGYAGQTPLGIYKDGASEFVNGPTHATTLFNKQYKTYSTVKKVEGASIVDRYITTNFNIIESGKARVKSEMEVVHSFLNGELSKYNTTRGKASYSEFILNIYGLTASNGEIKLLNASAQHRTIDPTSGVSVFNLIAKFWNGSEFKSGDPKNKNLQYALKVKRALDSLNVYDDGSIQTTENVQNKLYLTAERMSTLSPYWVVKLPNSEFDTLKFTPYQMANTCMLAMTSDYDVSISELINEQYKQMNDMLQLNIRFRPTIYIHPEVEWMNIYYNNTTIPVFPTVTDSESVIKSHLISLIKKLNPSPALSDAVKANPISDALWTSYITSPYYIDYVKTSKYRLMIWAIALDETNLEPVVQTKSAHRLDSVTPFNVPPAEYNITLTNNIYDAYGEINEALIDNGKISDQLDPILLDLISKGIITDHTIEELKSNPKELGIKNGCPIRQHLRPAIRFETAIFNQEVVNSIKTADATSIKSSDLSKTRYEYLINAVTSILHNIENDINTNDVIGNAQGEEAQSISNLLTIYRKSSLEFITYLDTVQSLINNKTLKPSSYLSIEARIIAKFIYILNSILKVGITQSNAGIDLYGPSVRLLSKTLEFISDQLLIAATGVNNNRVQSPFITTYDAYLKKLKEHIQSELMGSDTDETFNNDFKSMYGHQLYLIYQYSNIINTIMVNSTKYANIDDTFIAESGSISAILMSIVDQDLINRVNVTRAKENGKEDDFLLPSNNMYSIIDEAVRKKAPTIIDTTIDSPIAWWPSNNKITKPQYLSIVGECSSGISSIIYMLRTVIKTDIIRFKSLIIKNEEDQEGKISTTVTKFRVNIGSNNIPIYMDGHEQPVIQNLGGSLPTIELSCVTNDLFLIDDITAACQELDITFRTRTEMNNPNPLSPSFGLLNPNVQSNSVLYNLTRASLQRRINKLANQDSSGLIGEGQIDAPIIITNNIANMAGVYGCVVRQIAVTSIPGFPSTYQIDLSMTGVDLNQQFRETPRKQKIEVDPTFIMLDMCRFNPCGHSFIGSQPFGVFYTNNIQNAVNRVIAKLGVMFLISDILQSKTIPNINLNTSSVPKAGKDDPILDLFNLANYIMVLVVNRLLYPIMAALQNEEEVSTTKFADIVKDKVIAEVKQFRQSLSDTDYSVHRTQVVERESDDVKTNEATTEAVTTDHTLSLPSYYAMNPTDSTLDVLMYNNKPQFTILVPDSNIWINVLKGVGIGTSILYGIPAVAPIAIAIAYARSTYKSKNTKTLMNYFASYRLRSTYPNLVSKMDNITTDQILKVIPGITEIDLIYHVIDEFQKVIGVSSLTKNISNVREGQSISRDTIKEYMQLSANKDEINPIVDFFTGFYPQIMKEFRKTNIIANAIHTFKNQSAYKNSTDTILKSILAKYATKSDKLNKYIEDTFTICKDKFDTAPIEIPISKEINASSLAISTESLISSNIAEDNLYVQRLATFLIGEHTTDAFTDLLISKTKPKWVQSTTGKNTRDAIFNIDKDRITWLQMIMEFVSNLPYMNNNSISKISAKHENMTIPQYVCDNMRNDKLTLFTLNEKNTQLMISLTANTSIDTNDIKKDTAIINSSRTITFYTAKLVAYRMLDSVSKYIVLPAISKLSKLSVNRRFLLDASASKKVIAAVVEKLYKENTSENHTHAAIANQVKAGAQAFISNKTLRLLTLTMSIDRTRLYDQFNAYPDRPLPVFGKTLMEGTGGEVLSLIQMHTAPDFFLRKDFDYTTNILQDMANKIGTAYQVLDMENVSKDVASSRDTYKQTLLAIADNTSSIIVDSTIGFETNISSIVSQIAGGNSSDNTQIAEHITAMGIANASKISSTVGSIVKALEDNAKSNTKRLVDAMGVWANAVGSTSKEETTALRELDKSTNLTATLRALSINASDIDQTADSVDRLQQARDRLTKSGGKAQLSSNDISLIKTFINPGRGAYNANSIGIMEQKLLQYMAHSRVSMPTSTMSMAFPTFKLYIIEEDAKEWLFFNDFYDYGAVKGIRIHKSRKNATETAYIELSNLYGRLTNVIAGRRQSIENPFYLRPSDEEEVSAMMLKVGASIQVRLGYSSHLGPENIVFSGRIQELQGTNQLIIIAQSHGVELTRTIGTGEGTNMGGVLNRIQVAGRQMGMTATNNMMGLVAAIIDEAKVPLRGMGTVSPFLGASRFRNVTRDRISGVNTINTPTYGLVGQFSRWASSSITKNALGLADIKLIDNRLTNVNLSSETTNTFYHTLFGRSRWLIYNETIWDSLQDLTLQLGNKICTVRAFDEDNTLVMDSDNGIYQRSMEDFAQTAEVYPIITDLEDGEKSAEYAIKLISNILKVDSIVNVSDTDPDAISKLVKSMLAFTIRELANPVSNNSDEQTARNDILVLVDQIVDDLKSDTKKYIGLNTYIEFAKKYDNASYEAMEILGNRVKSASANKNTKVNINIEFTNIFTGLLKVNGVDPTTNQMIAMMSVAAASQKICSAMKHYIAGSLPSFRPLSQVHIKTDGKDIIKNNIKSVAGFNKVDLSYIEEDIFGSLLGIVGMAELAQTVGFGRYISLDNLEKPSARFNIAVSLSQTIEYDKIQTYSTFQKNAAIRGNIFCDFPRIVANGILANLVRDYYDGELIILMDPTIEPWDIIFMHDTLNDMWGICQVKEVTHSFSAETGAVTVIKPDMYVQMNIDASRDSYTLLGAKGLTRLALASSGIIMTVASVLLGGIVLRGFGGFLTKIFKTPASKLATTAAATTADAMAEQVITNIPSNAANIAAKNMDKIGTKISAEVINNMADDVIETAGKAATANSAILREAMAATKVADDVVTRGSTWYNNVAKNIAQHPSISNDTEKLKVALKELNGYIIGGKSNFSVAFTDVMAAAQLRNYIPLQPFTPTIRMLKSWKLSSMTNLIAMGISSRIGRAILPNIDTFTTNLGEYLNQRPLTLAGLIQKGEPMIANVDGMTKGEFKSAKDWLSYKLNETLNPLFETVGNIEEILHTANYNMQEIPVGAVINSHE